MMFDQLLPVGRGPWGAVGGLVVQHDVELLPVWSLAALRRNARNRVPSRVGWRSAMTCPVATSRR